MKIILVTAMTKTNKPTKADAEHYMAVNDAPFHLERRDGNSRKPLVIVPNSGTEFESETKAGGADFYHFWGWDKVIAAVDCIKQYYSEMEK